MTEIPEKIDSKYRYVLLASQRAEQLVEGAQPKVDQQGKATRVAMAEISRELVDWDYGPAEEPDEDMAAEAAAEGEAEEAEA